MDIERLFSHPAFTSLTSAQMQDIRQFARDVQGKGAAEAARLYMQLNQKIQVTAAQRSAIVEAIRGFVPDKDKHKLNAFIKMLGR